MPKVCGSPAWQRDCAEAVMEYIGNLPAGAKPPPGLKARNHAQPCKKGMRRPVRAHGLNRPYPRITDAAAPVTPPAPSLGRSNGETVMDAVVKPWPKASLSDHVRK